MKQSVATTPTTFLAKLPPGRRKEMAKVRSVIKKNLPKGYRETVTAGCITYEVPLSIYPDTYNGHALWYVALGAHKSYLTLYLMNVSADGPLLQRLKDGFKEAGKKLDIGKACIHFEEADDLALDVIGETVAAVPMEKWIEIAKAARKR